MGAIPFRWLLFLACLFSSNAQAQQVNYDFYRNPHTPIAGTVAGCCWGYPGSALTASSIRYEAVPVVKATWVVVWNPNTNASPTGIRLVVADEGPVILGELVQTRSTNKQTPIHQRLDITEALNHLSGYSFQVIQQTFGNGGNGPLIYASWLEVVY